VTEQNREKILDKIKKLLTLSEGATNVHESAVAAQRAQDLIERHRIKEAEILSYGEDVIDQHELLEEDGPKVHLWKVDLAYAIAIINGCSVFYTKGLKKNNRWGKPPQNSSITIIGTENNVNLTRYLFWYLSTTIDRLCKKKLKAGEGKGHVWASSFRMGAVDEIRFRLKEAQRQAREHLRKEAQASTDSTALVKLDKAIERVDLDLKRVFDFIKINISLGRGSPRPDYKSSEGYKAGRKAGRNIRLDVSRKPRVSSGAKQLPK